MVIYGSLAKKVTSHDDGDESAQGARVIVMGDQTEISARAGQLAPLKKRRRGGNEDAEIWKRLRRNVPANIIEATITSMQAKANKISGYGMVLPPESLAFLQTILPAECIITEIDVSQDPKRVLMDDELPFTHDDLNHQHLTAMEQGGEVGMERAVGAVLETGADRFKVLCVEVYNRDSLSDPHAESLSAFPSSVLTDGPTTQYSSELKIVLLSDAFCNMKLVIGIRGHNFLITSGVFNQTAIVGPGRCAAVFPVNRGTRIHIRKEKQDARILTRELLGLAQVRSCFGHRATYTTRRAALRGFASVPLMPLTIFTLSQFKVPFSEVFRNLAIRARATKNGKIILCLEDIEEPLPADHSEVAEITRRLINLFSGDRKTVITGNEEAEKVLSELANRFSNVISDKNLTIARRISSRD